MAYSYSDSAKKELIMGQKPINYADLIFLIYQKSALGQLQSLEKPVLSADVSDR